MAGKPATAPHPQAVPAKRTKQTFSRGRELRPLQPMDLEQVDDFDALLARMARTSFQGRNLGEAAEVLELMFSEPGNMVVLTISGALTVAQQGPVFVELIRGGYVDAVVGTGALVTHDVIENIGFAHYRAPPMADEDSHEQGICRVYDSAELESSFDVFERFVHRHFAELVPAAVGKGPPEGSAAFCRRLGGLLLKHFPERRSIVSACAERGIPLYIPAFTDSEMALNLFTHMVEKGDDGLREVRPVPFNGFVDLLDYARRVEALDGGNLCIFTLGGGVPRNWAQQVAPTLDMLELSGVPVNAVRFSRGVRICPDPPNWGHLSGCTYSEGVSWSKFVPRHEGGRYAEVLADATLVLPLLVKGVLQRLAKRA